MRIDIRQLEQCCGCSACSCVCNHGAITMKADEYGFLYPHIDDDKCVDCGLCYATCQFNSNYKKYSTSNQPIVYGGRQKDIDELSKSQTAGVGALIYKLFLTRGGFAYGVTFDSDQSVIFKCVDNCAEAEQFRGSKYVQANISGIYKDVKSKLLNGHRVLFVGSPCQVAGLKAYIPSRLHTDLLTVDLICHCTTAPGIWLSYVDFLQNKYKSKIVKANFRDKRFGWHNCFETYLLENGTEKVLRSYDHLFFTHLNIRPSCTNCPFTNVDRVSDITIGDYWGWENNHSEFDDSLGVNLILINSDKGKQFFDGCIPFLDLIQTNPTDCLQPQLIEPIKKNTQQDSFLKDYKTKGIRYVLYKYGDLNPLFRIKKSLSLIFSRLANRTQ